MKIFSPKFLILGSAILVVFYFGLFPLLLLIWKSLFVADSFTLSRYYDLLSDRGNIEALKNTLILGLSVVLFASLIGITLGWLVGRSDLKGANKWRSLFSLPYIIPPYIGAIAWIELLNPKMGYINQILGAKVFNIYSMVGIIWVEGLFLYSFIFLATVTALEQLDASYEEAARMSGASSWRVFWDVTLPLIRPSIFAGAILTFVAAAASFGVPAMIGMPNRIHVLTTKIYSLTQSYEGGIESATALSVVLMAIALLFLLFSDFWQKRKRVTMVGGKSSRISKVELGRWRISVTISLILLSILILVLPFSTILLTSLQKSYGNGFTLENISFGRYFHVLFGMNKVKTAILNSLQLATLTATATVLIGTLLAYIKVRTRIYGRNLIDTFASLPYATPGVVVALGLIIAFSGGWGLNLYNTLAILFVAYSVKYLSFALRTSNAAFQQIDVSLEEAGFMSGASWFQVLKTIVVPLLRPAMVAGWFLIFMPVLSELTMSILLFGPKTQVIGTVLYNLQSYDDPQAAAVLAILIVVLVVIANLLVKWLTKGKYGF